jgi:tRNA-Thr(GGU) m(6)t(6)A37 methyltransferase TsaA
MDNKWIMQPIGFIRSDFKEKFGLPRQSGRAPSLRANIEFLPEINLDCFKGLQEFSHIWILFAFSATSEQGWNATVRPPRLGGNKRVGVFASRSPFRPNRIGISCVKLIKVEHTKTEGTVLIVSGADLLDNTPIFDVKPYLPHSDCILDAVGGYADEHENDGLQVHIPDELLEKIPKEKLAGLRECLADDPRPSYQDDPNRVYGMRFAEFNLKFKVANGVLTVEEIETLGS